MITTTEARKLLDEVDDNTIISSFTQMNDIVSGGYDISTLDLTKARDALIWGNEEYAMLGYAFLTDEEQTFMIMKRTLERAFS